VLTSEGQTCSLGTAFTISVSASLRFSEQHAFGVIVSLPIASRCPLLAQGSRASPASLSQQRRGTETGICAESLTALYTSLLNTPAMPGCGSPTIWELRNKAKNILGTSSHSYPKARTCPVILRDRMPVSARFVTIPEEPSSCCASPLRKAQLLFLCTRRGKSNSLHVGFQVLSRSL